MIMITTTTSTLYEVQHIYEINKYKDIYSIFIFITTRSILLRIPISNISTPRSTTQYATITPCRRINFLLCVKSVLPLCNPQGNIMITIFGQ